MHHTAVGVEVHLGHEASLGKAGGGHSHHSAPQLVTVSPRLTPESGPRTRRRSLLGNCTPLGSHDLLPAHFANKGIAQGFIAKQIVRSQGGAIAVGGTVLTFVHLGVDLLGRLHDRFSPHLVLTHGAQLARTGQQGRMPYMSTGGAAHWGRGGRRGGQTGVAIAGSCGCCGSKT